MFDLAEASATTPEAFLGAVHPEDRARIADLLQSARAKPDVLSVREFRVLRQNGDVRWFIVRAHT
jgi:hypothetical protein